MKIVNQVDRNTVNTANSNKYLQLLQTQQQMLKHMSAFDQKLDELNCKANQIYQEVNRDKDNSFTSGGWTIKTQK